LAPWNVSRHDVKPLGSNGGVAVDGRELVFFHYHGLHLRRTALGRLAWETDYPSGPPETHLLWRPYVQELERAIADTQVLVPHASLGVDPFLLRVAARREARRVVPRAVRQSLRRWLTALPSRHSWKSGSVAKQHRKLVLEQLEHPDDVAPFRAFIEVIAELLDDPGLPNPARLLDFGCGAGHYSELLERNYPARFDYTGCDFSEEMVETAQGLWPSRKFVVNDVFDNHLDLSSFDVICASALVDVLSNYERALDVLLGSRASYVVLHRQRVTDGSARSERTSGYKGQKTFASYIPLDTLEEIAARHSRRIAHTFLVEGDVRSFVLPLVPTL
jgi:SAM-dependent methyltransferase